MDEFIVLYKLSPKSWNFQIDSKGDQQLFSEEEARARCNAFNLGGFPAKIARLVSSGDGQKTVKNGGERDDYRKVNRHRRNSPRS